MEFIDYHGYKICSWKVGSSTFLAAPELGARLMNWHIRLADGSLRDVIYWPDAAPLDNISKIRGGNPILFPFCARSYDEGECGYWRDAEGNRLKMPNHGFARQAKFELVAHNNVGFLARYNPDEAVLKECYPYRFEFSVQYIFEELAVHVDLTLKNLDTRPIPWSAGHHFYFVLPWHKGASRSDYVIQIPTKKAFYATATGDLESVKIPDAPESFDSPDLLDRIHCKLKKNEVSFGPKNGEENITLSFGKNPHSLPLPFETITTWTESAASPFYCVEPWMGPPNAHSHKGGLHWVQPGASEVFSVSVSLK